MKLIDKIIESDKNFSIIQPLNTCILDVLFSIYNKNRSCCWRIAGWNTCTFLTEPVNNFRNQPCFPSEALQYVGGLMVSLWKENPCMTVNTSTDVSRVRMFRMTAGFILLKTDIPLCLSQKRFRVLSPVRCGIYPCAVKSLGSAYPQLSPIS